MKFKRKYDNFDDNIMSNSESDIESETENKTRLIRKPNVKRDYNMTFYLLERNELLNKNHVETLRKIEKLKSEINMIEQKEHYLKLDLNNALLKVEKYKTKYDKAISEKKLFTYWNIFSLICIVVSIYYRIYQI